MREYYVHYDTSHHTAMLDRAYMEGEGGIPLDHFPVVVERTETRVLDIIDEGNFHYVVTLMFNHAGVILVLNEENQQLYFVEYEKLHNTHTFPTIPPVTVSMADFE